MEKMLKHDFKESFDDLGLEMVIGCLYEYMKICEYVTIWGAQNNFSCTLSFDLR